MEEYPDSAHAPGRSRSAVTPRAVLWGVVSVVFMCWLANYQLHVTGSSVLTLSNFPVAALIIFMLWLMINGVVRAISPRRAFTPGELLTIMLMAWAAGMMPARGWSGRMIGNLACLQHYASAENRWEEILVPVVPRWLFPALPGASAANQAGNWFYTGLPRGATIPWAAWSVPLFWWSTAALAALGMALSVSVIFHRQWVHNERLTFPLVGVPLALVDVRPGERVARIFKCKAFWIGFAVVAGPLWWNISRYFIPSLPPIGIYKSAWELRQEIVTGFPYISFRIMPPVIGFLYLCNLDLLFSLWVFWLVGWLEAGFSDTLGLSVGAVGKKLSGYSLVSAHNYGALVFLVLWSFWVARRHLREVLRRALSRRRHDDNPGGVMSYRSALVMLVLATAYLVLFSVNAGMQLPVAILAVLFLFVAFFVVAKYMAATGLAYILPPGLAGGGLLESLVGSSWWTPRTAVALGLMHAGPFGASTRFFGFGMMPHALKVREEMPRRGRGLMAALVLAIAVGAAFSIYDTLRLGYTYAALRMDNFTLRSQPQNDTAAMAERVEAVTRHQGLPPDSEKLTVWGVGFAGAALFTFLHVRFTFWPLHPLGFAFSASSAARNYWLSIIIVWFAKLVILKTGGVRLYERAKPFFIGLIVGYVVSLILSYGVHEFFPGQVYKVVHDW